MKIKSLDDTYMKGSCKSVHSASVMLCFKQLLEEMWQGICRS